MSTLYVTQPGSKLQKSNERLIITQGDEVLKQIPIIKVDQIVLMGKSVSITTPLMHELVRRKIDIVYLTGSGKYAFRVQGERHNNVNLRHMQSFEIVKPEKALAIASQIVCGKISNQRTLIRRYCNGAPWASNALNSLQGQQQQTQMASNLEVLRGIEGTAAKDYFAMFRKLLKKPQDGDSWNFFRRAYYPPTDPINAMLSFGYTLLLRDINTSCQMIGLDPCIGFFHVIHYGRPSMALDLMEEFRPIVVDTIVLQMVNQSKVRVSDFETKTKKESEEQKVQHMAILMKDAVRKEFITQYEKRVNQRSYYPFLGKQLTYRQIFSQQAQLMARVILKQEEKYVSYTIR